MFDDVSVLAAVRAGEAEPGWLVLSAQRVILLWRLLTLVAGVLSLEVIAVFMCLGILSAAGMAWLSISVAVLVGSGLLLFFRKTLRKFVADMRSWSRQYVVITPDGFLIATTGGVRPRFAAAFAEVEQITFRAVGGDEALPPFVSLVVWYNDGNEATLLLDQRFGPMKTIANACRAAHSWYSKHAKMA